MKFKPNKNFPKEAELLPSVVRQKERTARGIVSTAKGLAPRDSGDYRDSLKPLRLGPRVYAKSGLYYAHIIEWGGGGQPPQAPLRRAALSRGLRLDESKKV